MADARERIEKAAVAEFAAFGLHGARVQRIAERAGVNKQLIYYYFGSKRQLHGHAMGLAALQISPGVGQGRVPDAPPRERLRQLLHGTAQQLREQPNLVRTAFLGAMQSEAPDGEFPQGMNELVRQVAAEVSQGQGLGYFRDDADPDTCGRHAAVLLLGWVALDGVIGDTESAAAEPAWIASVSDLLDRSLTW